MAGGASSKGSSSCVAAGVALPCHMGADLGCAGGCLLVVVLLT